MLFPLNSQTINLTELFSRVYAVGRVTPSDRQVLRYALMEGALSEEDRNLIDRLIYAVRRGWLKMTEC